MKIKPQMYCGLPAIAIYITDATTKIADKLMRLQAREQHQTNQQTESYSSTVGHELRTPLLSIMFFLHRIIEYLQ